MLPQDGTDANAAMEGHEGSNIYGWLDLQRLAGNFRISVRVEEFFMLTKVLTVASCCVF